MTSRFQLPSPADCLKFVAFFNGVQCGVNDEPLFELWTLRVTLSPALIKGGTFARETIVAALTPATLAA